MWNVYLAVEKEAELLALEHEQKSIQAQSEIATENDTLNTLRANLEAHGGQRDAKIALLPEEWATMYENMRGRVLNPVVPVSQDSCSACFYLISSRDLQALRHNGILSCKDCYRFLYFDHDAQIVKDAK